MGSVLDGLVRGTRTVFERPELAAGLFFVALVGVWITSRNDTR